MRTPLVLAAAVAGVTVTAHASATSIIKDPHPPRYALELEPKLNLAYFGFLGSGYGGNGWGPGVRFSIPVMSPGFIKKINDSVTISFGADFVRYEGYRFYCNGRNCPVVWNGYDTSFWSLHLPVALQWNFFLTDKWSVFGEPGLTVRRAFYADNPYYTGCDPRFGLCTSRDVTDVFFTFFAGGRFHFSDKAALTMRVGYPIDFSIGVSFFL
jgi:hypothetical protein